MRHEDASIMLAIEMLPAYQQAKPGHALRQTWSARSQRESKCLMHLPSTAARVIRELCNPA